MPLFTVPTSSWRCTNSNRTSNAYSNDFPMQLNSLQRTNHVPPQLTRAKRPLSHAAPTPKKTSRSLSCQTRNSQTFALCHLLTIPTHRYLSCNICASNTSPVLQMMANSERLQSRSLSNCRMRMRLGLPTANYTATEVPMQNPTFHVQSLAFLSLFNALKAGGPKGLSTLHDCKTLLIMCTDQTHLLQHQQLPPAKSI